MPFFVLRFYTFLLQLWHDMLPAPLNYRYIKIQFGALEMRTTNPAKIRKDHPKTSQISENPQSNQRKAVPNRFKRPAMLPRFSLDRLPHPGSKHFSTSPVEKFGHKPRSNSPPTVKTERTTTPSPVTQRPYVCCIHKPAKAKFDPLLKPYHAD